MRNTMVFKAAADAGLSYSPECAPVDLYINNEYLGSYLLTSKIEADSNRIDVEDLDEINEEVCVAEYGEDFDMDSLAQGGVYGRFSGLLEGTNKYVTLPESEDITAEGGYVLEMEIANRYPDEKAGFVTKTGQPFIMKSPEYAGKEQMDFISGYYQRFEDAAFAADGKNADGESCLHYFFFRVICFISAPLYGNCNSNKFITGFIKSGTGARKVIILPLVGCWIVILYANKNKLFVANTDSNPGPIFLFRPYKLSPTIGAPKVNALCNRNWCVRPVCGINKIHVSIPDARANTRYSVTA